MIEMGNVWQNCLLLGISGQFSHPNGFRKNILYIIHPGHGERERERERWRWYEIRWNTYHICCVVFCSVQCRSILYCGNVSPHHHQPCWCWVRIYTILLPASLALVYLFCSKKDRKIYWQGRVGWLTIVLDDSSSIHLIHSTQRVPISLLQGIFYI